ncbi:Myelin and lymphocyte protein [Camelus dromedarius]|uniref:Myelin and lymphocyte protein n=1 Tax=Camelus dromedarius TaxID=9838 RepID=A0A5N4CDE8_CAMDR|nr:Myelin and lymphocyte protein [Camelus dromedarius]
MPPSAASGGSSLPSGFAVFTTFPDLLFVFEFVFGGLVWILISSSLVPIPLVQGWVMFVSVFCFVTTTLLLFLYVIGAHGSGTFWITLMTLLMATKATSDLGNVTTDDTSQDAAYHCVASLFYFGASVLEAFATIQMQDGFRYKQYHENISAVVFGGLVWILISSSLVPIPLVQGWVMFVSVFCFVTTTLLLFLYVIGAHGSGTFWITLMTLLMATKATSDLGNVTTDDTSQDAAYHCVASLFYFGASVLEAFATIQMQDGFRYKQYHENISAVVFSYTVTLLYVVHAVFSLIRWKSS